MQLSLHPLQKCEILKAQHEREAMADEILENVAELISAGIKAKGPWGELETETPVEGIIVAVGIALGLGAVAFGLVKKAFKTSSS